MINALKKIYEATLRATVAGRWLAVLATVILFVGTIFVIGPRLGLDFFPESDQGVVYITVEMPSGTSLSATDEVLATIENRFKDIPEIMSIYSSLGGSGITTGINYGQLIIKLKDTKDRERSIGEVINQMRPVIADIPDVKLVLSEGGMFGPQGGSDLEIEVTGDEMDGILAVSDSVQAKMRLVKGLADIQLSWKAAKPEIKFIPDRNRIDEYGTTVAQMGMGLRNALSGNDQAVFRSGNDECKIRIQYDEKYRKDADDIENVSISTRKGIVPIKVLNKVKVEGGAANVSRKNRQRLVTVSANISEGSSGKKAAELKKLTDAITLKDGYGIYYGGQQEMMAESFATLFFTLVLAIVLTYMVLAGSIESFMQPLLIMITIPLGLIGVLWALFLTGISMSMISIMSFIMLVGVVVNNAILVIDYAHQLQREGKTPKEAIIEASVIKFDAVIMMNLAIVLAQLPQAINVKSMQGPFAITAIGGIVVSTFMTLFVIPALYVIVTRAKKHSAV
jgi:HAE1 family hydrophobic/amphiphilic exporter-1